MQTIAICILHYANKEKFYSNINRFQIQSPPLSRNKVSNDYCIKTSYSAETVDSFDKKSGTIIMGSQEDLSNSNIKTGRHFIIDSLFIKLPYDIDNYPYYMALMHDNRNCVLIFWKIFKEKEMLLRALNPQSNHEMFEFNISLYLLYNGLLFTINALMFSYNNISSTDTITFIYFIDNLYHPLCSLIFSFIVYKSIEYFCYYASFIDVFTKEIHNYIVLGSYINKKVHNITISIQKLYYILYLCVCLLYIYGII